MTTPFASRTGPFPDPTGQFPNPAWQSSDPGTRSPRAAADPSEGLASTQNPVFARLLGERIIMLGSEVKDDNANEICAALLLLAAQSQDRDIWLYINSPGGSVSAGMAVYDTMQFIRCDVATVAMGLAGSMGQFLLTAGAAGKRYALPHARIMMHQVSGGMGGSATDIRIQAEQILLLKRQLSRLTADHSGQTVEQIEADADRDRWFTAEQARDYGLIDQVMSRSELTARAGR